MGFISDKAYNEGYDNGYQAARYELMHKARKWLKENMYIEHIFEHDEDEVPVQYVCVSACDSIDEFVNNFRKVMEE